MSCDGFDHYLSLWGLKPDGEPIVTKTSRLLPVRSEGGPAMLKIAEAVEEKIGGRLMAYWESRGAAQVLASEGDALLMERAEGASSLASMAREGHDEQACRIICRVAAALHAPPHRAAPELIPLTEWFRELEPAAARYGGILSLCSATAHVLLAVLQEIVVLHGDIHHDNILDFGSRGWLAIDPKGLCGERAFDYANLFCNPDFETATAPGRLASRAALVAAEAHLDPRRLLQWTLAGAGLSAAWSLGEGDSPETALNIAATAATELQK